MKQEKSLIDEVAENLNLNYISDMRCETLKAKIYSCVIKIHKNNYSLKEWAMLYTYLSSNSLNDDELEQAYETLLEYLDEKK